MIAFNSCDCVQLHSGTLAGLISTSFLSVRRSSGFFIGQPPRGLALPNLRAAGARLSSFTQNQATPRDNYDWIPHSQPSSARSCAWERAGDAPVPQLLGQSAARPGTDYDPKSRRSLIVLFQIWQYFIIRLYTSPFFGKLWKIDLPPAIIWSSPQFRQNS